MYKLTIALTLASSMGLAHGQTEQPASSASAPTKKSPISVVLGGSGVQVPEVSCTVISSPFISDAYKRVQEARCRDELKRAQAASKFSTYEIAQEIRGEMDPNKSYSLLGQKIEVAGNASKDKKPQSPCDKAKGALNFFNMFGHDLEENGFPTDPKAAKEDARLKDDVKRACGTSLQNNK